MALKITGELIREYGKVLRNIDLTEQRAAELALEVERHNSAILNAGNMLQFNDEPAKFLSALVELQGAAPRTPAQRGRQ